MTTIRYSVNGTQIYTSNSIRNEMTNIVEKPNNEEKVKEAEIML